MIDWLVEKLFRSKNQTTPRLTKEQKKSVRDGFSVFNWGFSQEGNSDRERYDSITGGLIENEEEYGAFEQWFATAHATLHNLEYLRVSEKLLQVASRDSLLRFADFIQKTSPNVYSLFMADYLRSASKTAINIARNHQYAFDAWLDTTLDVLVAFEQDKVYGTGEASKEYFELSERILQETVKPIEVLKKIFESIMPLQQAGVLIDRFFESCSHANKQLDSDSYINWLDEGMQLLQEDPKRVRAYFSMYSQFGQAALRKHMPGIGLEEVRGVLQLYSRALTGSGFILQSMNGHQDMLERPYADGTNIWLPDRLHGYGTPEDNFQAYKVLVTCQAVKKEFGTFALEDKDIQGLVEQIEAEYSTQTKGDTPLQRFYSAFPSPDLAKSLFELIEGKRIINRIKENYRGISAKLDKVIQREAELRPLPEGRIDNGNIVLEAFAQYMTIDNVPSSLPPHIRPTLERLYQLAAPATAHDATVVNALSATAACYKFFRVKEDQQKTGEEQAPTTTQQIDLEAGLPSSSYQGEFEIKPVSLQTECIGVKIGGKFAYPQWSINAGDYLPNWCKVKELELQPAENVPPLINATLHSQMAQLFERMYHGLSGRKRREPEGEDINIDALVEFIVDRAIGFSSEPRFYIQRRKQPEGIATAFLIDVSPSALKALGDGRRVIDAERESLELLVAGMEQVGHTYGIFGFSGYKRDDVRVYVVNRFDEKFERSKLYALKPIPVDSKTTNENPITLGTYTGPAIRHITQLLAKREEAVKVLFLLTDSDMWADSYYAEYARMDVNMAFLEAKKKRIHPFAISFGDTQREKLTQMYGRNFVEIMQPAQLVRQLPRIYTAITR